MKYTQEDAKAILELIKSLNISRTTGDYHKTIVYQAIEQYEILKHQCEENYNE